jgi:hypothetical protein
MPKQRRTDTDIVRTIHELASRSYRPAEIRRRLVDRFGEAATPTDRTVENIAREVTPRDSSGDWSPTDSDNPMPQLREVLATVIERTEGRKRHLTKREAETTGRLLAFAPDVPPWQAYVLARWYLAEREANAPTEDLDEWLAFAPWQDGGARYERAFERGWIDDAFTDAAGRFGIIDGYPGDDLEESEGEA